MVVLDRDMELGLILEKQTEIISFLASKGRRVPINMVKTFLLFQYYQNVTHYLQGKGVTVGKNRSSVYALRPCLVFCVCLDSHTV